MTDSAHMTRPRIALVDDDEATLWVGRELLEIAGCDVHVYSTPAALLTDLNCRSFDGFVVDWHLGQHTAEDIITVLRSRPSGASAPIVLLTGETNAASVPALAAARSRYRCMILTKPTPWRTVYEALIGLVPAQH